MCVWGGGGVGEGTGSREDIASGRRGLQIYIFLFIEPERNC